MLARLKNGFLACLACFLATNGAFALLPDQNEVQTALLTPSREVIYVTRSPLAEAESVTQQESPEAKEKNAHRVNNASPTDQE